MELYRLFNSWHPQRQRKLSTLTPINDIPSGTKFCLPENPYPNRIYIKLSNIYGPNALDTENWEAVCISNQIKATIINNLQLLDSGRKYA